jgi:hypothetical protein
LDAGTPLPPEALLLNPDQGDYQANIVGLELKLAF